MKSTARSLSVEPAHPLTGGDLNQASWKLFVIWFGFRLSTIPLALFASKLRPITDLEKTIPIWPPAHPFGAWLERVFLAPWHRWDAVYYVSIVKSGYDAGNGTAQFHPLFPMLAAPVAWLLGHPMAALLFVSSLAGALLLPAFHRIARLDLDRPEAWHSTMLLLMSPLSFVLFVPYTEAPFLLFSVLCLYWSRRSHWGAAGAFGSLATLTRPQGLFLTLPLCWEIWESAGRDWRRALRSRRAFLLIGSIPITLLAWVVCRTLMLGDFKLDLTTGWALLTSLLISPSAPQVVPIQTFTWPWYASWFAMSRQSHATDYDTLVDMMLGSAFLALTAFAWHNMRPSYKIYVSTVVLASFSYWTGPVHPCMGLPRHLFLAFPVFVGLGPLMANPFFRVPVLVIGGIGMFFLLLLYVIQGWVP